MPEQESESAMKVLPTARSDDFASHYANNLQCWGTAFDMEMIFGKLQRSQTDGGLSINQNVSVVMSWLEAKLAAIFIALNVAAHEEAFGTIKIDNPARPAFLPDEESALPLFKIFEAIARRATEPPRHP